MLNHLIFVTSKAVRRVYYWFFLSLVFFFGLFLHMLYNHILHMFTLRPQGESAQLRIHRPFLSGLGILHAFYPRKLIFYFYNCLEFSAISPLIVITFISCVVCLSLFFFVSIIYLTYIYNVASRCVRQSLTPPSIPAFPSSMPYICSISGISRGSPPGPRRGSPPGTGVGGSL